MILKQIYTHADPDQAMHCDRTKGQKEEWKSETFIFQPKQPNRAEISSLTIKFIRYIRME